MDYLTNSIGEKKIKTYFAFEFSVSCTSVMQETRVWRFICSIQTSWEAIAFFEIGNTFCPITLEMVFVANNI